MKRGLFLAGILSIPITYPPAQAMTPQVSAAIMGDAQLVYYRNFSGGTYTFNGFLFTSPANPHLVGGQIFPNGQGLISIPDLSLGECLFYSFNSVGDMVDTILTNGQKPYGPEQTFGGCTDTANDPPELNVPSMSCSTPNNGHSFGYTNINPLQAQLLERAGAMCGTCPQGPTWYPCQAGLLGCSNPPTIGTCTPSHY